MNAKPTKVWTAYEDAAFLMVGVLCQSCKTAIRDDQRPTPLSVQYPTEGWAEALGKALRDEGWLIAYRRGAMFDINTTCPACVHQAATAIRLPLYRRTIICLKEMRPWRHAWVRVAAYLLLACVLPTIPVGLNFELLLCKVIAVGAAIGAAIGTIWNQAFYAGLVGAMAAVLLIRLLLAVFQ
ncbi:MAG: hypothetical protein SGJ19_21110 [Planctomycetia bacterium]|nr:hypothetical protein [Planctomycetia bacterium]